jgi:hypothetical protein
MDKLEDYIKITPSISKKLCKKIVTELKKSKFIGHTFSHYSGGVNDETKGSTCQSFYDGIIHEQELMDVLHNVIRNYIETINSPYFVSWNGYTSIKFNKYEDDGLMEKHWDAIHSMFDGNIKGIPTLSIIGNLNNNFHGGEIEMFEKTKIKLKVGEVLIFPSTFLYPHMVYPVTKGTRYSFVSWVY